MILARVGARACCISALATAALFVGTVAADGPDAAIVPNLPRERLDDPPAPAEVLARRAQSPGMIARLGAFVSVQVNVSAVGTNIVGDAANEPSIAIDPTDPSKMAIGWRQFDTITSNFRQAGIAFSTDGGQTWTFPGVLDPGQFRSDPVLGSDAAGNFYYSSLSSLRSIEVFKSIDGGATWGTPVSAFGGDKQWIAVDGTTGLGAGNVYQIWNVQYSCCGGADFTRSSDGGASFDGPYALPTPKMKWGTLDVGPDGTLYVAGTTLNQAGHVFGRSLVAQNAAANPTFDLMFGVNLGGAVNFATGPNPAGLLGQTWIAVDHSSGPTAGNIYVLQSVNPPGPDPLDVHFIRSEDGGFTWSAPVRVNDDPIGSNAWQWFGTMSVAPGGRIDVVWNDTRNSGVTNLSELFHSSSFDGGLTWEANVAVSPMFDSFVGWPSQNKLGDYYHMISDDAGASLAYAATFNGEQDVYFLRIPADCSVAAPGATDCNSNGIADACDIADCLPNDVACADCNGNGLPDACDLPPLNPLGEDCNA
ncbi:MAG: exo-alpha-sialidase, partial [Planctomycetes bacterium]|nr:exo-alpha-sialidase [Planctomycetota bacterium]